MPAMMKRECIETAAVFFQRGMNESRAAAVGEVMQAVYGSGCGLRPSLEITLLTTKGPGVTGFRQRTPGVGWVYPKSLNPQTLNPKA